MVWEGEDPAAVKIKMPAVAPQVRVRSTVEAKAPLIAKAEVPWPPRSSSGC